ncbi:MAG: hypothetical protein HOK98_08740 [Rhodospirillaceae bacterium]|jgi:hypothetical protein|nr:hypothetical protein [Rhodospirillaceae bacterium]
MIHSIDEHLSLAEVEASDHHIAVLFEILGKRRGHHRISHGAAPGFEAHRDFVHTHPYRHWFLVSYDGEFIGTIYLTKENVLGVFVDDTQLAHLGRVIVYVIQAFDPLPAIPSIRNAKYTINLSPENTAYAGVIEELGGRLIQQSYVLPDAEPRRKDPAK